MLKLNYFVIGAAAILVAGFYAQTKRAQIYKARAERFESNYNAEARQTAHYKTKDSLNAANVYELRLTIAELKQYRAEDLKDMQSLQLENRDLKALTKTNTVTTIPVKTVVRDSIFVYNNIRDTFRCIDFADQWSSFKGCTDKAGNFTGTIVSREELKIFETVRRKRFLGFMWKTQKIKDRRIEVLSKNPNTVILNADFVKVEE